MILTGGISASMMQPVDFQEQLVVQQVELMSEPPVALAELRRVPLVVQWLAELQGRSRTRF